MNKNFAGFIFLLLLTMASFSPAYAQKMQKLSYLIRGGLVFDGTMNQPVVMDIGISGDKIIFLGNYASKKIKADTIIEAAGLYVCPGFIDPHTHNDRWLNSEDGSARRNLPSLAQGVTTVFIGNDGAGTFAVDEALKKYDRTGIGTNVALFTGLSPIREAVLGKEDVEPDSLQLGEMKKLMTRAMEEGAFGLSTGLYYAPQTYASTDEVIALAAIAKKYGGIYDTHMRSESNELIEAIKETIHIGRATGITVMVSHIKALGPAAWGQSTEVIRMIEAAREEGMDIFANQYPYTASHTGLKAMTIPPEVQAGGDGKMIERLKQADALLIRDISKNLALRGGDSRITISQTRDRSLVGKSLHHIAAEWRKSPEEAIISLVVDDPSTSGVSFSMDDADVENFMKQSWVLTGSDGGGRHPRAYGTFVRKIRQYSLEDSVISLVQAIHSSTGLSAEFLGLKKRGFIREGYFADFVIFDPEKIKDEATFQEPEKLASGVNHVFLNGVHVVINGRPGEQLAGKTIRHSSALSDK